MRMEHFDRRNTLIGILAYSNVHELRVAGDPSRLDVSDGAHIWHRSAFFMAAEFGPKFLIRVDVALPSLR
jgi:hypothetical protein